MIQRDGLLDIPILYLSRYITTNKEKYYRLLQSVREENRWEVRVQADKAREWLNHLFGEGLSARGHGRVPTWECPGFASRLGT